MYGGSGVSPAGSPSSRSRHRPSPSGSSSSTGPRRCPAPPGAERSAGEEGRPPAPMTSSAGHGIVAHVDEERIEQARERLAEAAEGRAGPADVDAVLERARSQIEALAAAAAELEGTL